jgi:pimeloyl-ACP methyl ester carboxylesterase
VIIRLADGRALAVTEVGPQDGRPVMYLHGAIGAPLEPTLAGAIEALGIRLILPQRPGFGRSEPQPRRTLLHFAADLEQLADRLELERFSVVGVSAGGPYAMAAAHRLSDRLNTVGVVSSLSPLCAPADVPGLPRRLRLPLKLLAAAPRTCAALGERAVRLIARHPGILRHVMTLGVPRSDRGHVARSALDFHAAFLQATSGGVRGLIDDHLLTSKPWGFALEEIACEVHVWHGMADVFVPSDHALHLVAGLPNCRAWFDPAEGHFFFRRRVREILAELAPRGARTS